MSIERKKLEIENNKLQIKINELDTDILKVKNGFLQVEIDLEEENVTEDDLIELSEDLLDKYSKEELDKIIEDIESKELKREDTKIILDTTFEEFKIYSIVQLGLYTKLYHDLSEEKFELMDKHIENTKKLIEMEKGA